MNLVEAALRRASDDLSRRGVTWALVGGFAVSARAGPRFTHDVDIVVAVDDDSGAEALVRSLLVDGYCVLASIEHDTTGRLAAVRLGSPVATGEDVVVDVLLASSGIEPEIALAADTIEIVPGLVLPIATTGHLIALKLLARDDESRPQDLADLRALHAVATQADMIVARDAVRLISHRGFGRDRNLFDALDAFERS